MLTMTERPASAGGAVGMASGADEDTPEARAALRHLLVFPDTQPEHPANGAASADGCWGEEGPFAVLDWMDHLTLAS